MASLYKNNQIWYISIYHHNKRITRSLKTRDLKAAKLIKPLVEANILNEHITGVKKPKDISFEELVPKFLKANHNWSASTYNLNQYILSSHLKGNPLPSNPSSRATHIRHINQCWKWGLKNNLIKKAHLIPGDTKGESRIRTYTQNELEYMFTSIEDKSFNRFVRFAYYTGARSGEIRSISRDNVLKDSLIVRGKSGRRIVKLNS